MPLIKTLRQHGADGAFWYVLIDQPISQTGLWRFVPFIPLNIKTNGMHLIFHEIVEDVVV